MHVNTIESRVGSESSPNVSANSALWFGRRSKLITFVQLNKHSNVVNDYRLCLINGKEETPQACRMDEHSRDHTYLLDDRRRDQSAARRPGFRRRISVMARHSPGHSHVRPDLTKNQSLVMGALTRADGPLSAYTILDQLRDQGFRAPLQVYRALDKLVEFGMVHRL